MSLYASADGAKIALVVAAILFVVCAIVSAIDRTILWVLGFIGLALLAFGLYLTLTP